MANGPTLTSTGSMLGNGMALRGIGRGPRFGVMQAGRAGEVKLSLYYISRHYGGGVQHFGQPAFWSITCSRPRLSATPMQLPPVRRRPESAPVVVVRHG